MGDVWPFIIIYYKCNALYLMDYEDRYLDPLIVHDVKLYRLVYRSSYFDNPICMNLF